MKRFHLAIAVEDFGASLEAYSRRLSAAPELLVPGRFALWRTELLNVTISCKPGQAAGLRHVGFEDVSVSTPYEERDLNGIIWEYFSADAQMKELAEKFDL